MMSLDPTFYLGLESLAPQIEAEEAVETFKLMLRVADGFLRVLHNTKTILTKFNKEFRRSELQFIHDSHQLELSNLLKSSTLDYALKIPIPSGMKVSYLDTVKTLDGLFQQLDIAATADHLQRFFGSIHSTDHMQSLNDISETTKLVSRVTKDQVETSLRTVFSSDKTLDVTLGQVISSQQEFIAVDHAICQWSVIFQQVPQISRQLDAIAQTVDHVVTELERKQAPDHEYVKALYQLVRVASVQYDMLGVILHELQRVEHNFTLVVKKLLVSRR